MREILFRGKRIDNGEWVCGYYVYDDSGQLTEKPRADIIRLHEHPCGLSMIPFEVMPESISEFTGLTDKNGNKIFEGDIVKDRENALHIVKIGEYYPDHYLRLSCNWLEPIKLCNLYGVYAERITNDEHKGDHFVIPPKNAVEVIGNIHDNPELLKGDKSDA